MSESISDTTTEKLRCEVTTQAVDCILYNRHAWRAAVALLEPRTSASVVLLPVSKTPGDPVGSVATSKATVTFVLDVVDQSLKTLPREHQRIARLKWDEMRTHKNIGDTVNYSEKTIERRVEQVRNVVKNGLESLGGGILPAFWLEIDKMLSES